MMAIRFGADYYPEHWPEERWETDAQMMREAGFNVVRMAEFAWAEMEPREGEFHFDWLDRAIATLADEGIDVVLGTPTAAPPPWLTEEYPEVLPVDEEGRTIGPGARRHYCVNSEKYRDLSRKIVARMATRYGEDSRVIGWQTDNELGHPVCYCEDCREGFRRWLREKYGSLEALNEAWGSSFWSHLYGEWKEIPLPNDGRGKSPNPSLHLDFKRFFSASTIDYNGLQADILGRLTEDQWITHNFMGFFDSFDHYRICEDLELASWDHYPTQLRDSYEEVSAGHDLTYSFKDEPFWVMEEQCSYLTREGITPQPRPGEIRLWTYQSIAHGADGVVYFRWRPSLSGVEQFHGGVLAHDGSGNNPAYEEIKRVGGELGRVGSEIEGKRVESEVAILNSYEQRWSMETYRYGSPVDYQRELIDYYRPLFQRNLNVAFLDEGDDFSRYKLLLIPFLPLVDDELRGKLERFVRDGGVLLSSFRAGIKNRDNVMTDLPLPGELRDLFGISINCFTSVAEDQHFTCEGQGEAPVEGVYRVREWADCLQAEEAQVIANYGMGWPGGEGYAAVTENSLGEGSAVYVGCGGEKEFYADLIDWLIELARLDPLLESGENVEVVSRGKGEEKITFLLNHSGEEKRVDLEGVYVDLLQEEERKGMVQLDPYGVSILSPKRR